MRVLEGYEADIENYRIARDQAGKALVAIHDGDLWADSEANYQDFIDYLDRRWNLKRSQGYALMDAGRFALVHNGGAPQPTEKQLRVIKKIRPRNDSKSTEWEFRADAWDEIVQSHGATIEPATLNEVVSQQWSTPRARRNEITPEQRQKNEDKAAIQKVDAALEVLATMPKPFSYYAKRYGEQAFKHLSPARAWLR